MSGKQIAAWVAVATMVGHLASIVRDAERCKRNLARFRAAPTMPNFITLAVAEGVLIGDLRWL